MIKENFRVVVGAAIFNSKKEFLLAKRHSEDNNLPDFWSTPAGHIECEKHDYNILEKNLIREVQEELGIEIEITQYIDSHIWVDKDYKKLTIIFLCKIKSGTPKALDETNEVRWYSLLELSKLQLPPNVKRFLEKANNIITN